MKRRREQAVCAIHVGANRAEHGGTMSFLSVRVAGTGSFLPGAPVSNDRVEMVLGTLDKA
jgi:hypothetical protein